MAWQDFQNKNFKPKKRKKKLDKTQVKKSKHDDFKKKSKHSSGLKVFLCVVFALGLISSVVIINSDINIEKTESSVEVEAKQENHDISSIDSYEGWKRLFRKHLDWTVLEHGRDHVLLKKDEKTWKVQLTVNEELQKFIQKKLKHYDVDFAAVAVLDAKTGAVEALTSYSNKLSKFDLSLRAAYPAASVFKIISSAAALEYKDWNSMTNIRYQGNTKIVTEKNSNKPGGSLKMPLKEAFAKSINLIFGKIGRLILGKDLLMQKSHDFAFNEDIPFDIELQQSKIVIDDDLSLAKAAAGLGNVSLSPVHAAMIGSCIVNNGIMMQPYLVELVSESESNNKTVFESVQSEFKYCLDGLKLDEMKKLMNETIHTGTAKKQFRNYKNDSVLKTINMGGKTGSKTNHELKGWNEWFVGFAEKDEKKLALSVVIVSQKYWKIKPAQLTKDIIKFYFSPNRKANIEPKVIELQ